MHWYLVPILFAATTSGSPAVVLDTMALVNSYFQDGTPVPNNDWTGGVYMTGNMAHYRTSHNASLLQYAMHWGNSHKWQPAGYRGCHGAVGCPDNIVVGQGYAEIYQLKRNSTMISAIGSAIDVALKHPCAIQSNTSQSKDSDVCWWWIDAFFMALPLYARMGTLVGADSAERIWDYARAQYNISAYGTNASGGNAFNLWSPQDSLFYRDDSYIGRKTPNGHGVFWARGNGWAFAAMARTLEALPASRTADRAEYSLKLVSMAAKLKTLQGEDGCWRTSLEDADQFPAIETTGTSMFVFGLAWGINNGVLKSADYGSAATKGWACLNRPAPEGAVASNGRLGWCQPGGAAPAANFNFNSTSDYCVGTFLLAGSEMAKMGAR
jgi:rhamnogalacturonyl hydrolase YesR